MHSEAEGSDSLCWRPGISIGDEDFGGWKKKDDVDSVRGISNESILNAGWNE